jgi:uncharacterized surface anchored protein
MHKSALLCLFILITFGLLASTAGAADISGFKLDVTDPTNIIGSSGWNITLTNTSSGDLQNFTLTGTDGNYSFSDLPFGTYYLNETPQCGWLQVSENYIVELNVTNSTFTNMNFTNEQLLGNISGTKWNDLNGNGVRDPGEPGLSGWTIRLRNATTNSNSVSINDITDSNGNYSFTNLSWGDYNLTENIGAFDGWRLTFPDTNLHQLTVNCTNLTFTSIDFGNHQSIINGYKLDENGNGLSDWTISLYNQTTGELINQTTTDGSGYYKFVNLSVGGTKGKYTVNETPQPGYILTNPPSGFYYANLTAANPDATDLNFTNVRLNGSISGYKQDQLGDPIENWPINLTNVSGTPVGSNLTDQNGFFNFTDLPWDTYNVSEGILSGYVPVGPTFYNALTVNGTNLDIGPLIFTNELVGFCIEGQKVDNNTGMGLAGWNITVTDETDQVVGTAMSDGNGGYQVCGLIPGNYTVCEELKDGWVNVTDLCQNVTIVDANINDIDFKNELAGFCIEGHKFDYNTGMGLYGWNITVTDETDQVVGTAMTDGNGGYQVCGLIPGNYTVCEELKDGWVNVTPDCQNVTIVDANINDIDFINELAGFCIEGHKIDNNTGMGLYGWNITVTDETDQVAGTAMTDGNGLYQVCGLIPGNYTVCEELKDGWVNVTPECQNVTIVDADVSGIDFRNELAGFCIEGQKVDNNTGMGLFGWNVTITDETDQVVGTAMTDGNGGYQVCGLIPGNYTVCEELKDGWVNVTPDCQNVTIIDADVSGIDFRNELAGFCIDGYKIDNCTGDGLEGWNITVKDESEVEVGNATTYANGYYLICDLIPGNYTVCEEMKPGWTNLTPSCVDVQINDNIININFTNTHELCIEGYKFDEQTGMGLQGWNISVTDDLDQEVGTATTDENGFYQVCNLIPGNYTVCEEPQSGWVNVTPDCVDVTLLCNNLTVNFTNMQQEGETFCIDGYKIDNCTVDGLRDWNITVQDESQVEVGNATTDENGYYQVCNLTPGNYTVCEELKSGFANLTPSCVDVEIIDSNVNDINFTNTGQFCIEGYKLDEGTDEGLEGWNISVQDDSEQVVGTATTDENGYYQVCNLIPGDYTVCEELQPGWANSTPTCQNVTLLCNNLTVNFTNMQEEFCIDGYKIDDCTGEGLEGWIITVEDESEVVYGSAITDQDGFYQVCNLTPGDYIVCEELQDGWVSLTPSCVDVEITDADVNDVNFTNTQQFCIEGYKLDQQTGEGLPNWDITVTDDLDQEVGTATTDENGHYQVCDLIPGNYTVCEELQPGWVNVTPICQEITLPCDNLTVNFTNVQQQGETFCIDGYKTDNCTGAGLAGWTIYVMNNSEVVGSTTTDPDGFYQVCDLPQGNYTVCEMMQPGWMNLTPFCVDVEITDDDVNNINFTNTQQFCIEGYKFDQQTGLGLEGWTIYVTDESDTVLASTVTDQDGFYQICGLIPGDYIVCEELQPGWVNVSPICQEVTLPCENLTVNFTNMQQEGEKFCIDGYKIDNCTGEGLEGWNITVKDESDIEVGTAITDENGFYRVCNLIPGEYTVCEELQGGWMNLTPLCADVEIIDADVNDINFINTQMFCIEGHKIQGETGLGLPGWNVSVMDESGQEIGEATTDENGFYQVCTLIPGNYTVCEEMQPGFVNLTPICQNVTLSCENLTVDFVNDPAVCIEGYKIDNCTGLGIPGWIISVTDESGALAGSATTDADGFYQICGLIAGNYTVCEELQPGWVNLTPLCVDVVLMDTNVNNINFTNTPQFCINGYKIDEQTGLGLPGWNISVMDESGQNLGTVITDQNGFYQVCGLIPGNYTVCEEMQPGWMNLTPSCVDVTLPCNDLTINFTNMQTFGQICGWVGANCNFGEISPPDVRVRFALNASDLNVPGMYFETTTDIRGVYCISGLPTGQPLFGIALSPLAFPDRYLERPISYQIDNGKLITCEDSACTPQIPPLANNGTLQVNWVLTNNQAFFNPMPL